jgi:hypothetical protein
VVDAAVIAADVVTAVVAVVTTVVVDAAAIAVDADAGKSPRKRESSQRWLLFF